MFHLLRQTHPGSPECGLLVEDPALLERGAPSWPRLLWPQERTLSPPPAGHHHCSSVHKTLARLSFRKSRDSPFRPQDLTLTKIHTEEQPLPRQPAPAPSVGVSEALELWHKGDWPVDFVRNVESWAPPLEILTQSVALMRGLELLLNKLLR